MSKTTNQKENVSIFDIVSWNFNKKNIETKTNIKTKWFVIKPVNYNSQCFD